MLTAAEVRQIDRLAFGKPTWSPTAASVGNRVARARGTGLEFHDFRHYQPGDDPRLIDWTIHARLDQLVVREFRSDAHLRVHLLVDTSASMNVGQPDKLSCARKLAAVLSYVAIGGRDAVGVTTFDAVIGGSTPPATGKPQLLRVFETLAAAVGRGRSDVNRALLDYGGAVRGPGLVVIISDFFQEGGAFQGLRYLLHRNLTPAVVQIVAPEELHPEVREEVELVDIENAGTPPVVANARSVNAYIERLANLCSELGEFCVTHALPYMRVESSAPFSTLLHSCVKAGLLAGEIGGRWS